MKLVAAVLLCLSLCVSAFAANFYTTPYGVSSTHVSATNVSATRLKVTGIVTATYFEGDGSRLTGVSGGGTSGTISTAAANRIAYYTGLATVGGDSGMTYDASTDSIIINGNLLALSPTGTVSAMRLYGDVASVTSIKAAGIVTASFFEGDGSRLTNLPGGGSGTTSWYGLTGIPSQVQAVSNSGDVALSGISMTANKASVTTLYASQGISSSGVVTATYFEGNGSRLTGISGGSGGPAFQATVGSNQNISTSTWTKVAFNTEAFDTDVAYDSASNYRFQPLTAGKYFVDVSAYYQHASSAAFYYLAIYKNGSALNKIFTGRYLPADAGASGDMIRASGIVELNGSSDYIEVYTRQNSGETTELMSGAYGGSFQAFFVHQ